MPHYSIEYPEHRMARVFLDGIEQRNVIECDTDEGWLLLYPKDENDSFILDGENVLSERKTGTVSVILPSK